MKRLVADRGSFHRQNRQMPRHRTVDRDLDQAVAACTVVGGGIDGTAALGGLALRPAVVATRVFAD